jgi:hypothetical protein
MQELSTSDFNNHEDQVLNHEEVRWEDMVFVVLQIHQNLNLIPQIHPSNKAQNTSMKNLKKVNNSF